MNIAHIEEHSFIYGPGCRFVIWVQGCSIRCKGCWNQEMWSFKPKICLSVEEIFSQIKKEKDDIEGITLLGGEPLDQYLDVDSLFARCQEIGLTTMLFTGYEMYEIHQKNMSSILEKTDILITGRYEQSKRTLQHQWIGSTNQEIHFLTERYANFNTQNNNYVEITINESGQITLLGFPENRQYFDI